VVVCEEPRGEFDDAADWEACDDEGVVDSSEELDDDNDDDDDDDAEDNDECCERPVDVALYVPGELFWAVKAEESSGDTVSKLDRPDDKLEVSVEVLTKLVSVACRGIS
jgi:hypothetical protein